MSQIALITGGTSGLGRVLVEKHLAYGWQVIVVARRPAEQPEVLSCQLDLGEMGAADKLAQWLQERQIVRLDRLIHCAGVGLYGQPAAHDLATIHRLLTVNLVAPIQVTHALFPLVAHTIGQIVFISSVAADLPVPLYAAYGASKAALDGFARNLRIEEGHRIRVQTLHPGAAQTDIHALSGAPLDTLDWEAFPTAEDVGRALFRAIERGSPDATIGWRNWVVRQLGRWMPHTFERMMARRSAQ